MSKLRTPREKKMASLLCDRRNVFGENDKSSRKNIPRSKQRSHQEIRRAANQPLVTMRRLDGDELDDSEAKLRSELAAAELQSFRKKPDASLANTLRYRHTADRTPLPTDPRGYR